MIRPDPVAGGLTFSYVEAEAESIDERKLEESYFRDLLVARRWRIHPRNAPLPGPHGSAPLGSALEPPAREAHGERSAIGRCDPYEV